MKIIELTQKYEQLLNTLVTVCGWVLTVRTQKDLTFIKLNDGSNSNGVQLVVEGKFTELEKVNIGSSLNVTGLLVKSPAVGQPFEIQVKKAQVLGLASLDDYPLAKGKLPLDYLRNYAHLRSRTLSFGSIFRIKSAISNATHQFFMDKGYLHLNPNIITVNECEGGAGVFQLTEHDISDYSKLPKIKDTNNHDWLRDHFEKPAYLTVSSQLQLEALACSLGSVYTTNKSFRSEHSTTNKHLSEFEHLEIEDVFITIDELMQIGEDYIKFVGQWLLNNNLDDINNLGKFVSKGLLDRIKTIVNAKFNRVKYSEAIEILKKSTTLSKPVIYGEDLCSEFENYLTEYFKGPVFVSHWPIAIKSFYMKMI
jgi:asparaginyl-tRNA synthetase